MIKTQWLEISHARIQKFSSGGGGGGGGGGGWGGWGGPGQSDKKALTFF